MSSFPFAVEQSRRLVARSALLQVQAAGLREESRRLRRFAAWHYRLRIAGAQGDTVAHEVIDQLVGAPVCPKCVAAHLRLPLFSVQHVIGEVRRSFAVDTIRGCRHCGRPALTLHRARVDEAPPRAISTDEGAVATVIAPASALPSAAQAAKQPVALECSIAAKTIKIQLRSGRTLGEPDRPYVRCSERDCQHVDLNEPPCPLRVDMFPEDADRDLLVKYLAKATGQRFCFGCLTQALNVSHDVIRRLAWHLAAIAVTRVGRCATCARRAVTIQLPAAHAADVLSTVAGAAGPSIGATRAMVRADGASPPERVVAALNTAPGEPWCAACVALTARLGLVEVRVAIAELSSRAAVSIDPDGTCAVCLRLQTVVIV